MNKVFIKGTIKSIQVSPDDSRIKSKIIIKVRNYNGYKEYFDDVICYAYSSIASLIIKNKVEGDEITIDGYISNNGQNMYVVIKEVEFSDFNEGNK